MSIFELLITTPLGYIISFVYSFVENYGVAIILFTLIMKLVLLPLNVKQQKSMVAMQRLKPILDALQTKYKDDKERLSMETMKLYKEQGVNPAGGCGPLLIQLPILLGLYQVINRPLRYILHMSDELIAQITELLGFSWTGTPEIQISKAMVENADMISQNLGITVPNINFNFLGLDLSLQPQLSYLNILWIIPILSAATAYLSSVITSKMSGNSQVNDQMKTMNIIMPIMSGYFCFIMPAGVGLYWVTSNVIQILQTIFLNKILLKRQKEVEPLDADEYFKKNRKNSKKH